MAKKGPRGTIRMVSTAKKADGSPTGVTKFTSKNSRNTTEKLKKRMYDNVVRKHVEFVEEKMK